MEIAYVHTAGALCEASWAAVHYARQDVQRCAMGSIGQRCTMGSIGQRCTMGSIGQRCTV